MDNIIFVNPLNSKGGAEVGRVLGPSQGLVNHRSGATHTGDRRIGLSLRVTRCEATVVEENMLLIQTSEMISFGTSSNVNTTSNELKMVVYF